jgi:hypothetical protein
LFLGLEVKLVGRLCADGSELLLKRGRHDGLCVELSI